MAPADAKAARARHARASKSNGTGESNRPHAHDGHDGPDDQAGDEESRGHEQGNVRFLRCEELAGLRDDLRLHHIGPRRRGHRGDDATKEVLHVRASSKALAVLPAQQPPEKLFLRAAFDRARVADIQQRRRLSEPPPPPGTLRSPREAWRLQQGSCSKSSRARGSTPSSAPRSWAWCLPSSSPARASARTFCRGSRPLPSAHRTSGRSTTHSGRL